MSCCYCGAVVSATRSGESVPCCGRASACAVSWYGDSYASYYCEEGGYEVSCAAVAYWLLAADGGVASSVDAIGAAGADVAEDVYGCYKCCYGKV